MRILLTALFTTVLVTGPVFGEEKSPAVSAKGSAGEKTLKIGAVAYSPKSVDVFRGMRYYFDKHGMPIEFALFSTYDGLNEALAQGQVDVAWNSPLGHARFHLMAGGSQAVVMRDVDRDY